MKENYFLKRNPYPRLNRWQRMLAFCLMVLFGQFAFSQVTEYSFTQTAGTYTPITGGTVLWSGYDGFDDEISSAIPVSFVYQGVTYTSIFVSANGNIKFGATSTSNVPISGGLNAVAAFSVDLDAKSASAGTGIPEVRWEAIGEEFIIQWANVCRFTTSGATSAENLNFQIRLNTVTGEILIVYGACVDRATPSTTYPQVGLGGGSTTVYKNRTIAAGGGDWINSNAGTANNQTMAFNGTTIPSNGLTFSFTPPECSAPGAITVVPAAYSANISWASVANSDEYQWIVVADNAGSSAPPVASGTVSDIAVIATGLSVSTAYDLYVKTNCGADGQSVWSPKIDFTTTVACPAPTAGVSSGVTAYSATLGWTSTGTDFEINWGTGTFTAGAGPNTETGVSGNSFTFSNSLAQNTTYRWFIRRNCGTDEFSTWAGPFTFTTTLACPVPTAGLSSGITPNSATLAWTSTGDTFEVNWGTGTFTAGAGPNTQSGISGTSFTFPDNLTQGTAYRWFVRRDCNATSDGTSTWAGPYTFTTAFTAPAPYSQGFSTTTTPPGWALTSYTLAAANASIGSPSAIKFGDGESNILRRNAWSSSTTGSFTVISVGEIAEGHELTFDYKLVNYANDDAPAANTGTIKVEISTDYGATYSVLENIPNDGVAGWRTKVYPLDAYEGEYVRVKITDTWTTGSGADYFIGFDNIYIGAPPTCPGQTGLVVGNVTATGADFSWDDMSSFGDVTYEYAITTSATPPASGTDIGLFYLSIENVLTPQTTYYLHVRVKCDTDSYGTWATSAPFTTDCAPITVLPHLETFTTFMPTCWLRGVNGDTASGPVTFGTSTWSADGPGNVGTTGATRVRLDATGGNDWIISPMFEIPAAGYELRFEASAHQWASTAAPTTPWEDNDIVQVLVSTGTSAWTVLYTYGNTNVPSTTPTYNAIDISAYANQTVRFALRAFEGADNGRDIEFIVDNFEIRETPACPDQTGLIVSNITATGAGMSWDDMSVVGYEYAVTTSAIPPVSGNSTSLTFYEAIGNLDPLTDYYLHVRTDCGDGAYGIWASTSFKTLCLPPNITGTTPGSVCGQGTVELSATTEVGANIAWYANQTGGSKLGDGETFTTPQLTETTSFWVAAYSGDGITTGQAKQTFTGTTPGGYTLTAGLEFVATDSFTIVSVVAYSYAATGTTIPRIQLQNSAGVMIQEVTNVPIPNGGASGATAVPFTIALNFTVPGPGTYRLMADGSFSSLARDSGATNAAFPHAVGDVAQITQGILTASSATSYYFFYDWTIGSGCTSPRTEVVATVTQAQPVTLSSTSEAVCRTESTDVITLTSDVANYDSYSWSPATGVVGDAATGWTFTPNETTAYTLTSTQNDGSECVTTTMFNVVINETPSDIVASNYDVCEGSVVELSIEGGTLVNEAIIGTGTAFTEINNLTPSAFNNRYEIAKVQTIYTVSELQAAGFVAGKIESIAYNINSHGSAIDNSNYTVKIGHYGSESTFTTATFVDDASFTTCFGPVTYTRQADVLGWYVLDFDNAFIWDGQSNIIIQISMGGVDTTNNAGTQFTNVAGSVLSGVSTTQTMGTPTIRAEKFNVKMLAQIPVDVVWSPNTNLFTDTSATTAYTGTPASSVYFNSDNAGQYVYTATASSSAGCSISGTVTVNVNDTPDAPVAVSPQSLNEGQTLADLTVGGSGLVWYSDSGLTTEIPSTTVAVDGTTYYVIQTAGGCVSEATAITVEVTLGTDDFDKSALKVYPNPTRSILYVTYSQEISNVEIYNLIGQRVTTITPNANEGQVDMSNLASGAYFVKVTSNKATKTVKIIKE